jgi:hypothetical protein
VDLEGVFGVMKGRHLSRRSGFVFTLALAALSLSLAPGIAIADGVSTSWIGSLDQATDVVPDTTTGVSESVGDTTQAVADTTQAVADTTQAVADTTQAVADTTQAVADTTQSGTEIVVHEASGAGSTLNAAGSVVDKTASSSVSRLATGTTVQGEASGEQAGGATTTAPESTTAYGDPVASGADPRWVRSRDPMRIYWPSADSATVGSGSAKACFRVGAMCTAEASSSPHGSLGDAVVSAIQWLATTGLDILSRLALALGLALMGTLALEAARRRQPQPPRQET